MKPLIRRFVVATCIVASCTSLAVAQEHFQGDLRLRKTYLKTNNSLLPLNISVPTAAFTPTAISCQGGQACTVRIEFSTIANLMAGVPAGSELSAHTDVRVDGKPQFADDPEIVFPDHQVLLGFNFAGTSTFSWVTVVTPGDHTIEILVTPQGGGTGIFLKARTLTIDVYRP
ncbi:MAG TPA: hypothetical protein VFB99_03365 [Vicinamibacterales bacterium]|nr:hypothetical protein [Vicinamibacterales bacterium]